MRFVIAKMSMMTRKMASPLMRMMLSLVMMMMVSLVMRTMVFLGDDDVVLGDDDVEVTVPSSGSQVARTGL